MNDNEQLSAHCLRNAYGILMKINDVSCLLLVLSLVPPATLASILLLAYFPELTSIAIYAAPCNELSSKTRILVRVFTQHSVSGDVSAVRVVICYYVPQLLLLFLGRVLFHNTG